jgi:hypothetical protein
METWEQALKAWTEAGHPGGPSVDAYRRWTTERFGLDPHRHLHLAEKWALDDLSWADAPRGDARLVGAGTLKATGRYLSADASVEAELLRVEGPGGAALHPRARLYRPDQPLLNRLLAASNALRLRALLDAVLEGRVCEHRPLPGEARLEPGAFLLDPRADAELFKVWEIGGTHIEEGPRRALLLALELQVQANLQPWDGQAATLVPPWVGPARERHVRLLALLEGDRLALVP